jgi:hypothetical protein
MRRLGLACNEQALLAPQILAEIFRPMRCSSVSDGGTRFWLSPNHPEFMLFTRAFRHAARGVAYAAKGDVKSALTEQMAYLEASKLVPAEGTFGNNLCQALLAIVTPMQAGRFAEREQVYRDDLARLPENGWSLFGLARSLELQHKSDEAAAVEARFQKIWSGADMQITSSCLCQPGS